MRRKSCLQPDRTQVVISCSPSSFPKQHPMNDSPCNDDSSRFSIREFLILIGLIAGVLGGYASFGIIGAFSVGIILGTLLICHGRDTKRKWMVASGILGLVVAFSTLPFAPFLSHYGTIRDRSDFPFRLTRMIEISNAEYDYVNVYDLGSFIDSEYVWRLKVSDTGLASVLEEYKMTTVPAAEIPAAFFDAFPADWRPPSNSTCQGYSTVDFPLLNRGPETTHFFGMHDPETSYLYVWCKSNF